MGRGGGGPCQGRSCTDGVGRGGGELAQERDVGWHRVVNIGQQVAAGRIVAVHIAGDGMNLRGGVGGQGDRYPRRGELSTRTTTQTLGAGAIVVEGHFPDIEVGGADDVGGGGELGW